MPDLRSLLTFKETVRIGLWRGTGGAYAVEPDECPTVEDLIVNNGRIFLARRIAGGDAQTAPGSAMAYMAVGTVSTAAVLTDTTLTGEVKRKALSANSANVNNIYTAVTTFGGAAD